MRLDPTSYSCGPCAISAALETLGKTASLDMLMDYAGTSVRSGTDEQGVMNALRTLGLTATPISRQHDSLWQLVLSALDSGAPVILCVDDHDHWVTAIGHIGGPTGGRVIVFDSENRSSNAAVCGVWVYDQAGFSARLGESKYAIRVDDHKTQMHPVVATIEMFSGQAVVRRPGASDVSGVYGAPSSVMPDEAIDHILRASEE